MGKGNHVAGGYLLKTFSVPIPAEDRRTVIRKGKTVEYEVSREYLPDKKNTRVKRAVIGKLDPMNPGKMFPNERYFELIPENGVPDEIRDAFLTECAWKRDVAEIKRNPNELARRIIRGMNMMAAGGEMEEMRDCAIDSGQLDMTLINMFEQLYYYMEELATRFPNDIVDEYKVRVVNDVLTRLRESPRAEGIRERLELIAAPVEETNEKGETRKTGMTFSDVMMMLKWYKVAFT